MSTHLPLIPEIGPDGLVREAPIVAYTEKVIEEEQLQLKRYIEQNYTKIRDVERELENLTLELKLTAGSKNAALEHLRKKIESSTEKIRVAKQKEDQARKVWEAAVKAVEDEEEVKRRLCDDLNHLVLESTSTQFSRLEALKRRLEGLNPSRASASVIPDQQDAKLISQASGNATLLSSRPPFQLVTSPGRALLRNHVNGRDMYEMHGQNKPFDGEGKGRKKNLNLGRGKGRGKERSGTGWTGAGFDVDATA